MRPSFNFLAAILPRSIPPWAISVSDRTADDRQCGVPKRSTKPSARSPNFRREEGRHQRMVERAIPERPSILTACAQAIVARSDMDVRDPTEMKSPFTSMPPYPIFKATRSLPETCNGDHLSWTHTIELVSVPLESLYVLQDRRRLE